MKPITKKLAKAFAEACAVGAGNKLGEDLYDFLKEKYIKLKAKLANKKAK